MRDKGLADLDILGRTSRGAKVSCCRLVDNNDDKDACGDRIGDEHVEELYPV